MVQARYQEESVVGHWNRLPWEVITALSLPEFKKCLENDLRNMFFCCLFVLFFGWSFGDPGVGLSDPWGSRLTQDILCFCDSMKSPLSLLSCFPLKRLQSPFVGLLWIVFRSSISLLYWGSQN